LLHFFKRLTNDLKMKTRFTTIDIITVLSELREYVGHRVNQVYDVDNKTYLIRLQKPESKVTLLIESGTRLHATEFDWPKNPAPSGFSMKLRKHINNKRLEKIEQMGVDRVVDLQFGSDDAAYHLVLEMYDRGNLVLTDYQYKIMNILRPRVAGEEKFLVRETYPVELAKQQYSSLEENNVKNLLLSAKPGDTLKKVLMPQFEYGPSVLEHVCLVSGIQVSTKLKDFDMEASFSVLVEALTAGLQNFLQTTDKKGIIVEKVEVRPKPDGETEEFYTFQEFHPYLFKQYENQRIQEFSTFNAACDTFFSQLEAQKIELKTIHQEKSALKKLENVKKDHEARIKGLQDVQALDRRKGELIEMNSVLVENAIKVIVSALANQIPWDQIKEIIKEATENGDPVASRIKQLKFEVNSIVLLLTDPYRHLDGMSSEEEDESEPSEMLVQIDLDLSAQANARKYFIQKKAAATKEKKTVESGSVALKSAEKKTKQTLKEMATITNINKARKVYWFEKFFWFISSENFLVIGGRDAQQNELIVKRYMKSVDVYVHADLHGAASVCIKNPTGNPVPPKTLNEAAQFSVCFSAAWDSKVITSAYWVQPDQVSKTAQSGEYLTVGSFMIRGKKNYLPTSHLIMGFGFLFKLEDSSIDRHRDERKIRGFDEVSLVSQSTELGTEADLESLAEGVEDVEINLDDGDDSDQEEDTDNHQDNKLDSIAEQEEEIAEKPYCDQTQETSNQDVIKEEAAEEVSDDEGSNPENDHQDVKDEVEETLEEFPDTDVKIEFNRSGSVEVKTKHLSGKQETDSIVSKKQNAGKKNSNNKSAKQQDKPTKEQSVQPQTSMRGKKGKLKKMKEKYKDQDDEDRELAMQILQSHGKEKEKKKKAKQKGSPLAPHQQGKKQKKPPREGGEAPRVREGGEGEEEDKVQVQVNDETDMLDSLTGIPVGEDELLFAVPVCAPYSTLVNYKYKVKLTPGTGKRGKACKTALSMFLADKSSSSREKDLLKSVKDQDLARNLPGKVKLSAPHLQKIKSKK